MFAEFVATYVPIAIAAVVLVPVVLVHVAMFIDSLRTKRWPTGTAARKAPRPLAVRRESRAQPARSAAPLTSGGMGLRHGMAARRDHD